MRKIQPANSQCNLTICIDLGDILDIGECLCKREEEDSCLGSECFRQLGLSWYGPSCKDCRCKEFEPKNAEEEKVVVAKKR